MPKLNEYRLRLRQSKDWSRFLKNNSGLPGPRGNLELAAAFALEASRTQIAEALAIPASEAPENSPGVFMVFCGVLSLGRLIAQGDRKQLATVRAYASDPRWRIREAVAMALQTVGDVDMELLLREMRTWLRGNWYEKRAAAAALAEPRLLGKKTVSAAVLEILDSITKSMVTATDRRSEAFRALRQGMGYCWSVAIAAHPAAGKPRFERWLDHDDPDVRWMLKENLKKNRLVKADPAWVRACAVRLGPSGRNS